MPLAHIICLLLKQDLPSPSYDYKRTIFNMGVTELQALPDLISPILGSVPFHMKAYPESVTIVKLRTWLFSLLCLMSNGSNAMINLTSSQSAGYLYTWNKIIMQLPVGTPTHMGRYDTRITLFFELSFFTYMASCANNSSYLCNISR